MIPALFISDLHGNIDKYEFLFQQILKLKPEVVFIAGDLMGSSTLSRSKHKIGLENFLYDYLVVQLEDIP